MSIRIRVVDGITVALCAARSIEQPGDIYLDDAAHHALAGKFAEDFASEGYNTLVHYPDEAALRAREESNNGNRTDWDRTFGPDAPGIHGAHPRSSTRTGNVKRYHFPCATCPGTCTRKGGRCRSCAALATVKTRRPRRRAPQARRWPANVYWRVP